uniref:Peroxisomal biogenesis factor 26 n=1 Tax=Echeneis naucrates TaxID=173247 RepID=A0A665VRH5_ECHNA
MQGVSPVWVFYLLWTICSSSHSPSPSTSAISTSVFLIFSQLSSGSAAMANMLDAAAETMMVHKDFQAAFDSCDRGLQSLSGMDTEDSRCAELKAGFCILGIQALAELNRWHGVLSWVLQYYELPERIPAKIMQMCILLYSKVSEPAVMQETARVWLHCSSNSRALGFGTVAELYLLHILVPLRDTEEARELIAGRVGSCAFTEDQRKTALDVVVEKEQQALEPPPNPGCSPNSDISTHSVSMKVQKNDSTSSGSFSLQRIFLAVVLLYMLFIRMDPALPSSFMWISKLHRLLKQMWCFLLAPPSYALPQSKSF